MTKSELWARFQKYYLEFPQLGLALDLSRMQFAPDFFSTMEPRIQQALAAMAELEKGAIANPDENRMVGHYWLRNPALAPSAEIRKEIETAVAAIKAFAADVHGGKVRGATGPFKNVLVIGIGGSALGPQFVANALGHPLSDKMALYFFDNTDPDGMDRVLAELGSELGQTLAIVISKSGGTKETRNGMLEAEAAYRKAGLKFGQHTVAVTSRNSDLDKYATANGWINRFPMWDWVGGRTSELSAVGLLPAALQGLDIDAMLSGAKVCDELTRDRATCKNPAALMALTWFHSGNGKGNKNLIILPYKDRLELFSKYLQQLIMESLGKEKDLAGQVVHQGLTVLGNKGATDQHSYIQQLRDGLSNFFVTFIEVLQDREGKSLEVEPNVTSGDYLSGFYQGTRSALFESGRESVTLTIPKSSPFIVGALIALFERTVGLYASLINVNAYHQPGVEAGKKAATTVINLQVKVIETLNKQGAGLTAEELAETIGAPEEAETIFKICEHLSANPDRNIKKIPGATPFAAKYQISR
ncbi:MAG TPA: glucose-6-phosphate isomerase [Clostridia bacterium]|nr:glucose-6-phosphate isomerase [Clostridia bacterium]